MSRLTWDDFVQPTDKILKTNEKARPTLYEVGLSFLPDHSIDKIDIFFHLEHFIYVCDEFKSYAKPYDEDDLTTFNPYTKDRYIVSKFLDDRIYLEYEFITGHTTVWVGNISIDPNLTKEELIHFCYHLKYNDIYLPEVVEKADKTYVKTKNNEHHELKDFYIFTNKQIEIINNVYDLVENMKRK